MTALLTVALHFFLSAVDRSAFSNTILVLTLTLFIQCRLQSSACLYFWFLLASSVYLHWGPSLESIYRVSLTVDLCEGNKIF